MLTPHGIQCRPSDNSSLPDGRWLHYQRNGQGQVTALVRSPVQRPWLRKLAAEEAIASHLQRNLAGLQSYSAGNGIHSQWLRDGTGTLAGIVHSRPSAGQRQLHAQAQSRIPTPTPLWPATASVVQRLLGIGNAQASTAASATTPATPTALAFFDERYLWSGDGLLLHSQRSHQGAAQQRYWAYDGAGQLVAGVQTSATTDTTATDTQVWRYAYQGQRRVLAQHTASQDELTAGTSRTDWDEQGRPGNATYNANGQPTGQGQRSYQWDSLGRLIAISQNNAEIARYHYDHRGLRIAKDAGGRTTGYLYSADRHLLAELNASGHIERQYIYLADLLLAVIDTPKGAKLAQTVPEAAEKESPEPLEQTIGLWADIKALLSSYLPGNATLAYIHSNHLGAPEAATNENGELVWQASYAPFGAAAIQNQQSNFTLNIRLPGQYLDEETGLHYNRQRYYDPAQGAYLTPDPLGHPDGPNAYAYVANNPLGWIDPDGLVLFAFDGTENSDDPEWLTQRSSTVSNVVLFRNLYDENINGPASYITGVGTIHRDSRYDDILVPGLDAGLNRTGVDRIDRMMLYLRDQAMLFDDDKVMEIDIVGFSRGAAQARDFANQIIRETHLINGRKYYFYNDLETGKRSCQWVNFRFMGLFDTVLSTNSGRDYTLTIPEWFSYVAHAVALNEYRSQPNGTFNALANRNFYSRTRVHLEGDRHWGGFPLESIGRSNNTPGQQRIEMGFIGAHADIGGGYSAGENQLSQVALAWMVAQAQIAGVAMNTRRIEIPTGNVVIHDQSNLLRFGDPRTAPGTFEVEGFTGGLLGTESYQTEDRLVHGGFGSGSQRRPVFDLPVQPGGNRSMLNADTHQFITYTPRPQNILNDTRITEDIDEIRNLQNRTGTVEMQSYMSWLRQHGYVFAGLGE